MAEQERIKLEWSEHKRFEKDGLAVLVQRALIGKRPIYGILLGKVKKDNGVSPYIGIMTREGDIALPYLENMNFLIAQALQHVREQTALDYAAWQQEKSRFYHEGPMRKGKTQRDKEKGK